MFSLEEELKVERAYPLNFMKVIFRIKKNEDFGEVVKNGYSKKNSSFTIHYLKNNFSNTRVGISVSTKIGNAVIRNKIKRQIRAMCIHLIDFSYSPCDVTIIVKKNYLQNQYTENFALLQQLLNEAGIVR